MGKRHREMTRRETILVNDIADRASNLARDLDLPSPPGRIAVIISLCMTHKAMPLDLDLLLTCPDVDFLHDVYGILRHLNPRTGKLEDCFVPRTTRPLVKEATHG